ncbi:HvfC/BufC N-terminal domain-containing protein [Rubrivivax rivuli]|uniref:DUF2063 domain-containing protein n=1 Tax=Rubrivivax rivuli TaxID=1862385 RepID=A0A437RCC9_9BURK|nr:DNA-binding domain-containing protein [Rubrivivax rivuli]RVU44440.1 DUF2063 domain-containing protein [Rubrivivax rivuli]
MDAHAKEALRQQMLLRTLLGDARPGVVAGWLRTVPGGPDVNRGLAAYRAHASALAERALAAAFPTVQQLLGEESFALMARDFWRRQPPEGGDLACWGEGLAGFIVQAPTLADEPYLPDMARLEWALHRLQTAPDAPPPDPQGTPPGLGLLATDEPAALRLCLPPGSTLQASRWPVFSLWQAHRAADRDAAFALVRQALAEGRGEQGLLTRQGWAPRLQRLPPAEAAFVGAVLAGQTLATALQAAGEGFDFEAWLIAALQQRLLVAVMALPAAALCPPC